MNILEKIIKTKWEEVEKQKSLYPVKLLEQSVHYAAPTLSMKKYLVEKGKSGIIAEFKRKSPSRGDINPYAKVEEVSIGYMQAGCSGLSILTDHQYFGGSNQDLQTARQCNFCPILRKDFVVDEYQIVEARSSGADLILLIAEALEDTDVLRLAKFAKELQLEVLLEMHGEEQMSKLNDYIDIVGINNRNLKTFEVNVDTSLRLINAIPESFTKISESGISAPETIVQLKSAGFDGFLIGENFMRTAEPGRSCMQFIQRIHNLEKSAS
ncbi:MAG: indole-3-glycerol phosphate synthase TrpC [Saprospiraceae bacterium]|nr:indole-3-glycerol phosphate synthase TrpC [Saprospiraceae bacterium]